MEYYQIIQGKFCRVVGDTFYPNGKMSFARSPGALAGEYDWQCAYPTWEMWKWHTVEDERFRYMLRHLRTASGIENVIIQKSWPSRLWAWLKHKMNKRETQ